ncbi:hypothetical protein [Ancylobacter mangrovi]|uniref:hypothetical protein n=1 Tax=Ancylobacter mangrovi TaxID=2972472 RepID=UPI002162E4AB|nr:hypothetical protein [Ancylobacter mangrovi]MCS0501268.1 hypothetical protein [Ancylobacter mangrovi]
MEFVVPTDRLHLREDSVVWEDEMGLWCLPIHIITCIAGEFWSGGLADTPPCYIAGRA